MLNYTKESFNRLKRDLRIISWIFTYGLNLAIIAYYIFALASNKGNLITNLILLCITFILIVLSIIYNKINLTGKTKKRIKKGKHFAKIASLLTKAYVLGCTLYAMYIATTSVNPVEIILTTLLLLLWIISFVVELAKMFVDFETNRILIGLSKDFAPLIKVKNTVSETFENVKDGIDLAKSKVVSIFNKKEKKKLNIKE